MKNNYYKTPSKKSEYKVFYNNYKDYKIFDNYEDAVKFGELHNSPIEQFIYV